jgi:serine/threonine protein kinase
LLRSFQNPFIIRLLGFTTDSVDPASLNLCLVYELAPQLDLALNLTDPDRAQRLTWMDRVRILCGVGTALNYLHCRDAGRPAYHRDIKSANIVLTADLHPKLIDCGLAKYVPENVDFAKSIMPSLAGGRVGTQPYWCPSYGILTYDARMEVYSFGLVMAEVFTGKLQGIAGVHHREDGVEPSDADLRAGDWPSELKVQLCELIRKSLLSHKKRIPDMTSVLRSLREIQERFCPPQDLLLVVRLRKSHEELERAELTAIHERRERQRQDEAVALEKRRQDDEMRAELQRQEQSKQRLDDLLRNTSDELERTRIQAEHDRLEHERQAAAILTEQRRKDEVVSTEQKLQVEATRELVEQLSRVHDELEQMRHEAEVALQERRRKEEADKRTCVTCYDDFSVSQGVECLPADPAGHFFCDACFDFNLASKTGAEDRGFLEKFDCHMVCPICIITAPEQPVMFSDRDIVNHARPETEAKFQIAKMGTVVLLKVLIA